MDTNIPVAVIDVGSNSIKLLVAQKSLQEENLIESIHKEARETRISAGISRQNPKLTQTAMEAGLQSISELVEIAKEYAPKQIKIVATSAVRDATNGSEFTNRVAAATGVPLTVLSGIEEANYIIKAVSCDPNILGSDNFIHMDIGGGSLELSHFRNHSIRQVCSLQLGAVRLTEKFVADTSAAISPEIEAQIQSHVHTSLVSSSFTFDHSADLMVGTGGAFSIIRSLLAIQTGTAIENASPLIHTKDIHTLKLQLGRLSLDERKTINGLPVERADVIPAALITIGTVLEYAGRDRITRSSYTLRYGIAIELLEESEVQR